MIKFTSNNDFDFDCSSVEILRDTSKDLVKRASCEDLFKGIKKDPKQEDLHIIAVGAYEGTGCFFQGAPVQTIAGIKSIETLKVGDVVLTHKGNYKPITTVYESAYTGVKVALDIVSMTEPVECTANHPIQVIKAKNFTTRQRCPSLLDDDADPIEILDKIIDTAEYIPAAEIQPGDYVLTPINIQLDNAKIYTEDDAYLFGYYLSEGCLVKEYRPTRNHCGEYLEMLFTMAVNDQPCIDKLQSIIKNLNGNEISVQKSYTSELGRRLTFQNYDKAQECLKLFGCHSTSKFIHPEVFAQSKEWKLKFLSAYFDGDGCVISDDTNGNPRYIETLVASTASRNLAYDLQRLLASCGVTSSVYKGMNKHSNGCFGNEDHVIFHVSIGGTQANAILQYCLRLQPVQKKFTYKTGRSWISSNYLVLKVKGVLLSEVEDTTKYNLEVADDNTYVVDIQVHNSNRNGDCFLAEDCEKNHHYFTRSNRAVHRHHKNKPTDPKFGNIKAAAYNKKMKRIELVVGLDKDKCGDILHEQETTGNSNWSMACVSDPNFPILTNTGYVPIVDIKVGDTVYTHNGNWKKVTELCRSQYTGPIYNLSVNGLPEFPGLTPNHPLFATKFPELNNTTRQFRYFKDPSEFDNNPPDWSRVDELKVGDRLFYRKINSVPNTAKIDDLLLAKLLGYYTAEGSLSGGCVQLTCNTSDSLPRVIPQLFAERYPDITVNLAPHNTSKVCLNVNIFNTALVKICEMYVGRGCHNKFIAPEMFNADDAIKLAFMGCWIDGDGFCDNKGIHISSCNYNLILQGRDILMRMGIPSSIYKIDHAKCTTSGMENSGFEYTLNISWLDAAQFINTSQKVHDNQDLITSQTRKKPACLRETKDPTLFAYRISDIEIEEVENITVYNFEVEDDHSYSLGGVISHNSKQEHDICSVCGHKAKDNKTRCQHIPKELGEIKPDGRMVSMINPNPKWFEISYVKRPADRIGMSLGKVASINSALSHNDTDYVSLMDNLYIPEDVLISKKASDKRDILHKLSAMEKHVEMVANSKPANTKDSYIKEHAHKISKTPAIDDASMEQLRKLEPQMVLKTLADHGVVFGVEDFAKYLFDKRISKKTIDGMKTHLPSAFRDLEDSGEVANNERYEPDYIGKIKPELKNLAGKLHEGHSLEEGPVVRRIMIISISGGLNPHKEEEKSKEAADKELAKEYTAYKVAALNYMNEQGKLDDDIILNAVLQNR